MPVKKFRPTTNARRQMSTLVNDEITKNTPEKSLVVNKKKTSGRNNLGRITVRHRGGEEKRKYRLIDFKRTKFDITGKVAAIEYDPNRSANIALINYKDGEKRYIIAPKGLKVGDIIVSGQNVDVKVGNGALLKNIEDARTLAELMIKIGHSYQRKIICVLTNMDEPLGLAIGNSNEVLEAIDALNGKGPKDLMDLVKVLVSEILMANENISIEDAYAKIDEKINNKEAYNKFLEMVKYQGGDINSINLSKRIFSIKTDKEGYISSINALKLGELVKKMGGGRLEKNDSINHEVGINLSVKVGDFVKPNDELMRIYLGDKDISFKELGGIFTISQTKKEEKLIYEIIK